MDEDLEYEEENLLPEGTFAVQLSGETREAFELVPNWDLSVLEPQKVIMLDKIREDLQLKGEESDFFPLAAQIQACKLLEPLIIYDPTEQHGSEYLICLNGEAKYGYLQSEEDANLALVDSSTAYEYMPPSPQQWLGLESDLEIERDWVVDARPKIRLQIKRTVPRHQTKLNFEDRNVDDVPDGYVSCDSYEDNRDWKHVEKMERGMQGVPILVDGSSQTELKHPKNVYTQYEPRVFSEEEVDVIWQSDAMKKFLSKMDEVLKEVAEEPDIMGGLRNEIEAFYKRDHVEVVEETDLVETMFFTDLNFSHNLRATQIRWHPSIPGIMAMSVMENTDYESYLDNLSQRLVKPNMVMIWSTWHPLFPQILLRVCDDVTKFEWHPNEDSILVGGCMNGQVLIWDIDEYLPQLMNQTCIWNHKVILDQQTEKLHVQEGFIPILYWSAESSITFSHKSSIEDFHWLPKNVWVWDLRRPPAESGLVIIEDDDTVAEMQLVKKKSKRATNWEKLKAQSAIPRIDAGGTKYTPAIGKYSFLNKIWKPVHKICFLDPNPPPILPGQNERERDPLLKILITTLSVTVKTPGTSGAGPSMTQGQSQTATQMSHDGADVGQLNTGYDSDGRASTPSLDMSEDGIPRPPPNPSQQALPTMLMAGTILGSIFRADLSKNKVDVETNNLLCTIEWITPVHDGPVKVLMRSPFIPNLLLSVGGYSFAIWNEGVMTKPVLLHFVDGEQFTAAAWSMTHPSYIFFAGENGNLQIWDITKRKSEPIQCQNIAGKTVNAICLCQGIPDDPNGFFISVADDSGTLRLMKLPKHLWQCVEQASDLLASFIENEIAKKQEKERMKSDRIRRKDGSKKRTLEEELDEDTKIEETRDEFITFYFRRERAVMEKLFGDDWKKHLRYQDLKREKYYVDETRHDSSSSSTLTASRKQSIVSSMVYKSKGVASLMKF